jgi:NAD(P)-dependent dehydrogenase (short-subunit alcohol dehydrogenase family)
MQKTILITGASNGFGNDTARTLAAAGHRVFATMRGRDDRNRDAAAALQAQGIETIELDVTSTPSVDAALKTLAQTTGGTLDVLINNAGIASVGLSETFAPEQVRDMFEVNVFGIQRVLRAALPLMRKNRSGLVINVGSILGRVTVPFLGLYGASKHAVEAMTESYRYELSQLGIDIIVVQPGPFPTGLYTAMQTPSDPSRGDAYGEVAALPGAIATGLEDIFKGNNAPDPHEVATAIASLIATPAGHRPNRVLVGLPFGAGTANAVVEPLQMQLLAGFGLERLATLKQG